MLDRLLGRYLVSKGFINGTQLSEAYHKQEQNRAKLGVIAVSEKLMSIAQAEQVNSLQATMDKRFGDIAVEKGYLTEPQVTRLLELQGNAYLAFLQAVVDLGYLTMQQLEKAENEYQAEHGFTETDMMNLKSGDVEKIVPIFIGTTEADYINIFSMAIKDIYRLVDNHVYIGNGFFTTTIREEAVGYQKFHGDQNATVAIAGKIGDVQKLAIAYTKEEFIETEEDALDATCELINCMNGLYATEMSKKDIKIELEPPDFSTSFKDVSADRILVLPVYTCGGEVKCAISVNGG